MVKKFKKTLSKLSNLPFAVDLNQLKSNEEYFSNLISCTYFVPRKGPEFEVRCGRIRLGNKENVKNIINLIYEFVPQVLAQSEKNSTVKKISLNINGSKDLPLYENDFVVEMN